MARQQKMIEGDYVRKQTFLIVTLLALAIGFLSPAAYK